FRSPLSSATVSEYRIQEFQQSLKRGDKGPTRRGGNWGSWHNWRGFPGRMLKKFRLLTRPTPARRDAPFTRQRSRIVQRLNESRKLESLKGFSVRQDPVQGRTAHTKCGLSLFGSSLAAALPAERRVLARRGRA